MSHNWRYFMTLLFQSFFSISSNGDSRSFVKINFIKLKDVSHRFDFGKTLCLYVYVYKLSI